MRRSEDSRSAIDRVDESSAPALAEAYASFTAIWGASKPLPCTLFSRTPIMAAESALPQPALPKYIGEADCKVVNLQDYARLRRH